MKGRSGPESDVYSLGVLLSHIVCGAPHAAVRARRAKVLPGAVPELALVARRAAARRPSRRYPTAEEFAREVERALAGEGVRAGRSPILRRLARAARIHPYATLALSFALVATLVAGTLALLERRRQEALATEDARERSRFLLGQAERSFSLAGKANEDLARALESEREALAALARQYAEKAPAGVWGPAEAVAPGAGPDEGETPPAERIEKAALASRIALDSLRSSALAALSSLAALPEKTPEELARRASELRESAISLLLSASLSRIDIEVARARDEERRLLSTQTFPAIRAREGLFRHFERRLSGGSRDAAAFEEAVHGAGASWQLAARSLDLLLESVAPYLPEGRLDRLGPTLGADLARAAAQFSPAGRFSAGRVPRSLAASLVEVDSSGPAFRLIEKTPLESGSDLELPAGEYLAILSNGVSEVRHSFLIAPGETYEWSPDWPEDFPEGDWVYIGPAEFRAGGEAANAGPYRVERIDQGYFIARKETTLGEYLEFLRDLRARGQELGEYLPRAQLTDRVASLVSESLAIEMAGYTTDMPACGITQLAAIAYADWKTTREGRRFTCRLPSEAEWELAARGAGGRLYPWGDSWIPDRANLAEFKPAAFWFAPAGSLVGDESIHGIRDLAGNVREWTASRFAKDLVTLRGGWNTAPQEWARVAARDGVHPSGVYAYFGFRLVCVPAEVR